MRILNLADFLALPCNVLFSKYEPCTMLELQIKGDSLPRDFLYQDIAEAIACTSSEDFSSQLFLAQEEGRSVAMDFDCLGRDGCFEDGQLFAVWEPADVQALITRLQECRDIPIPPKTPDQPR